MDTWDDPWSADPPIEPWITANFPSSDTVHVTSPRDRTYNCLGWAAGFREWWEPDLFRRYKWPDSRRNGSVAGVAEAFARLGFEPCDTTDPELGIEKVALFGKSGMAGRCLHAARQLPDGRWTSKLGDLEDVEHSLDDLNGGHYGEFVIGLKRPRA